MYENIMLDFNFSIINIYLLQYYIFSMFSCFFQVEWLIPNSNDYDHKTLTMTRKRTDNKNDGQQQTKKIKKRKLKKNDFLILTLLSYNFILSYNFNIKYKYGDAILLCQFLIRKINFILRMYSDFTGITLMKFTWNMITYACSYILLY